MMATTTSIFQWHFPLEWPAVPKKSPVARLISNHEQVPPAHRLLGPVGNQPMATFCKAPFSSAELPKDPNMPNRWAIRLHSSPDKSWWFTKKRIAILEYLPPNPNHHSSDVACFGPCNFHRGYEPLIISTVFFTSSWIDPTSPGVSWRIPHYMMTRRPFQPQKKHPGRPYCWCLINYIPAK